jgi:hypothetical protein
MTDKNQRRDDGQAVSLSNLRVAPRYLDSDYEISVHDLMRGQTGLLRVFSLMPKGAGKPRFHARVDDGSTGKRREPDLDIDITEVSDAIVKDFKAGRNGYIGHHTDRSPNRNHRIFDVEIAIPNGKVFEGEVSFNATFSIGLVIQVGSSVAADATVKRAGWPTRLRNWLRQLLQRIRSIF